MRSPATPQWMFVGMRPKSDPLKRARKTKARQEDEKRAISMLMPLSIVG